MSSDPHDQMQTVDLTLPEVMRKWPTTVPVFLRHGMLCVGCRVGPFHTIADACAAYDLDEAAFRRELSDAVNAASRFPRR